MYRLLIINVNSYIDLNQRGNDSSYT